MRRLALLLREAAALMLIEGLDVAEPVAREAVVVGEGVGEGEAVVEALALALP